MLAQSGRLFALETSNFDEMISSPYITEVTPTFAKAHLPSSVPSEVDNLRFRTQKKTTGEQNNEKGSMYLVLAPTI